MKEALKQEYNKSLWRLPSKHGEVSVMSSSFVLGAKVDGTCTFKAHSAYMLLISPNPIRQAKETISTHIHQGK